MLRCDKCGSFLKWDPRAGVYYCPGCLKVSTHSQSCDQSQCYNNHQGMCRAKFPEAAA